MQPMMMVIIIISKIRVEAKELQDCAMLISYHLSKRGDTAKKGEDIFIS